MEETRNNEKSSPWVVLLSPQLEGKKLTTVFSYVSKEELSVIQLKSPFFF